MVMSTVDETPREPDELSALGAAAHEELRAGRLAEAAEVYRRILALRPELAEARNDLGILLAQLGRLEEARSELEQVVAQRPELPDAHNNLALVLRGLGKLDGAISQFEQAIALRPNFAEAYSHLANVLSRLGRLAEAAGRFEQVLALRPDNAGVHNDLGVLYAQLGKLDEAVAHFRTVITLKPDFAEAYNNLGNALSKQHKLAEAAEQFQQALALRPDFAEAYNNLGTVLTEQDRLDEAIAGFQRAIALKPDYPEALNNLGKALLQQDEVERAIPLLRRVLALRPDHADAECSLAMSHLLLGDFETAWPHYEARLRLPGLQPPPHLARWTGQPLAGSRLLLLAEQGVGDTIHFLRYARLLKSQGARVVLAVRPAAQRLLASHPDVDELYILDSTSELPACDFYLPLLSAPGALGTTVANIPGDVPYLWADPALEQRWQRELAALQGFKIGIVWQGAPGYEADRWRSIPLAHFAPLARLPGVRLISLQKGFGVEQIAAVDFPLIDLSGRIDEESGPFMDTAAILRSVDLVVAPDTAIAHLGGALAAPVFLALPFSADWRWLRGREDTPWYPTMRLFRQKSSGDWPEVFARLAQAIQQKLPGC